MRIDGRTDMTKIIVNLSNFVNAPKTVPTLIQYYNTIKLQYNTIKL